MKFDDLWAKLVHKNPDLRNESKVTITAENFRLALRQAYEIGERAGHEKAKAGESLFDSIFGRR